MQIEFAPDVALQLEAITAQTYGMEFSGFGFVEIRKETGTFYVYEFVLMDVGNRVWTEIPAAKMAKLYEREDSSRMKIWLHRHPPGNGIPGPHNWSGTDNNTCRFEPLGVPHGMQDSVKWSLAAVRTPNGWVGRYDTYGPKGKTVHISVVPAAAQEVDDLIFDIQEEKRRKKFQKVRQLTPFVQWNDADAWEGYQDGDFDQWLSDQYGVTPEELEQNEFDDFQMMFWDLTEEL